MQAPAGRFSVLGGYPMPMTPQLLSKFSRLASDLSPENLYCDGEISQAEAMEKKRRITKEWRELEQQLGRKITEDEVWRLTMPRY